jgi:hypothetical protein
MVRQIEAPTAFLPSLPPPLEEALHPLDELFSPFFFLRPGLRIAWRDRQSQDSRCDVGGSLDEFPARRMNIFLGHRRFLVVIKLMAPAGTASSALRLDDKIELP